VIELVGVFGPRWSTWTGAPHRDAAGRPEKLDDFERLLEDYELVELQRSVAWRCLSWTSDRRACRPARLIHHDRTERTHGTLYYEADADPSLIAARKVAILATVQGHATPSTLRVGRRRAGRAAARVVLLEEGRGGRPQGHDIDEAAAEADVIMILLPDTSRRRSTTPRSHRTERGRLPDVRPRLQHPLRPDRAPGGRRCGHGRAEEPGTWSGAPTPRVVGCRA